MSNINVRDIGKRSLDIPRVMRGLMEGGEVKISEGKSSSIANNK